MVGALAAPLLDGRLLLPPAAAHVPARREKAAEIRELLLDRQQSMTEHVDAVPGIVEPVAESCER